LVNHAFRKVYYKTAYIRKLYCLYGPTNGKELHTILYFASPSYARRIYKDKVLSLKGKGNFYGISGGARYGRNYNPLLFKQGIYKGGLSHIGPSQKGYFYAFQRPFLFLWKYFHKLVKEFIHAPSMLGRYGEKPFKAKRIELINSILKLL